MKKARKTQRKPATRLIHSGRERELTGPFVNPPVVRASTVLFETVEDMEHLRQRYSYGRFGTPTSDALEAAMNDLEGSDGTALVPSGLTAAALALLSCLAAGDRVLITDSVYGPVRRFADHTLKKFGVEVAYFAPTLPAEAVGEMFTPETRALYLESPGSLTFEMQDVAALAAVARRRGATVLADNTWATPLYFQALDHGVDLSIHAGTKYLGGHSDVMFGTVSARGEHWKKLRDLQRWMGLHLAPDDTFLGLRGIRTLAARLAVHQTSALKVARWLAVRPEVSRVLYPALESDPGHALWKRDMGGATGLFSIVLSGWSHQRAAGFVDQLELFGIGASWGGFESLATVPTIIRTASPWTAEGAMVRLHIGLDDPDDLVSDLDAAFASTAAGG
jgi:cysteine-S-conjugate beta-lyase